MSSLCQSFMYVNWGERFLAVWNLFSSPSVTYLKHVQCYNSPDVFKGSLKCSVLVLQKTLYKMVFW
jgi:hypothetical protein